jgi:hypothetical protein
VQLSSVEIDNSPAVTTTALSATQGFRLPNNYARGQRLPSITGFQFCQQVTDPEDVTITATLEANIGSVWTTMWTETVVGTHAAGDYIWTNVLFSEPVVVDNSWFSYDLRVTYTSNTPTWQNRFRMLANTAESGEDFLGNQYRSVVARSAPDVIETRTIDGGLTYWYSKPNPSKYAVESMYFDLTGVDNRDSVFDRLLLDPITPGIVFHVYFSSEGDPGLTRREWEDKLWSPVSHTFVAQRRQEHAMPTPVSARYVKIEFSHLQAQHYSPGTYHEPIRYQKFPKWVQSHFLPNVNIDEDSLVARRVAVIYDLYQLAYDAYIDDLKQIPADPNIAQLQSPGNLGEVDYSTLIKIRANLQQYQEPPASLVKSQDYLLSLSTLAQQSNYPVENLVRAIANTTDVSNLNREALLLEQAYPKMFFYLTSRHAYREVEANFSEDRAYFAGIRELAFTRDTYSVASDNEVYVDTLTDFANAFRNDFLIEEGRPKLKKS